MKPTLIALIVLIFAGVAAAAGSTGYMKTGTVKTSLRAIGYPKPHAKKLGCRGIGRPVQGEFTGFRCVATYKHHHRITVYAKAQGEGGWLCAGSTLTGCKLLRHGFISPHDLALFGEQDAMRVAAKGYVQNRYGIPDPQDAAGTQTTCATHGKTFSCGFAYQLQNPPAPPVIVTITVRKAQHGLVTSAKT